MAAALSDTRGCAVGRSAAAAAPPQRGDGHNRPVLGLIRALWHRDLDTVHWLLLGQMIMFTGIAAIFPVVPLYVARHGGGATAIAAFVAGPMIANALVQLPAGRLVDRVGPRRVMLGSRLIFAAASFLLFANLGPLWLLGAFRVVQGASGGAYVPALRVALADLTAPDHRAERYSELQAAEMVGLLIGPAIGGAIALWQDSGIFLVSGIGVLLGLGPLLRYRQPVDAERERDAVPAPRGWWRRRGIIVPALALISSGALISMYDVVWPQYLIARDYSSLVIGLSISLYAVPILLLAGTAGRLADRVNRRLLMLGSFLVLAATVVTYPLLHFIGWILLVGMVEAVAEMFTEPTLFATISESAPRELRGRAMGIGGMFEFAGSAGGAGILGSLYGVGVALPFQGAALMCIGSALLCGLALPRGNPGRGAPDATSIHSPVDAEIRG